MFAFHLNRIVVALVGLSLILSACTPSAQNEAAVATAVAQTLEAAQQSPVTATPQPPLPTLPSTLAPAIVSTPTNAPTLSVTPLDPDCIHALYVGEDPPDQAVFLPNTPFAKTWTIRNVGTCTWDYTYRLIFWSGDTMGSATYYNFPEIVPPGAETSITIQLTSPAEEGFYTGYWRLQTPWSAVFGVGQYSQSIFATIQVDKRPKQEYGVLSVTYKIVREPPSGCPANVTYTVYATITTSGPLDMGYYWDQKDGNESAVKGLSFSAAGSKTVSREWMVGRGDSPNDRWMRIIVVDPEYQEFDKAVFKNDCP